MKPNKIVSMATIFLLMFAVVYSTKFNLEESSIYFYIINLLFTFIFPAFIFIWSWFISYKRKENNLSLSNFYLKVFLNAIIPYFICMIPYIIYEFGLNNLRFNEVIKIFLDGNISYGFLCIKTAIHLLIMFPLIEFLVKKYKNGFMIFAFAVSAVFELFSLENYIFTDAFNYLIYAAMGSYFTYNDKYCSHFLRIRSNFILSWWLFGFVFCHLIIFKFNLSDFIVPAISIFYNIAIMLFICKYCYWEKALFLKNKNYLCSSTFFRIPIIAVSTFLLLEIVALLLKELYIALPVSINNFNTYIYYFVLMVFAIIFNAFNFKRLKKKFERKTNV